MTEENDRLKEDIIRQSGENFYNNTFKFQKRERTERIHAIKLVKYMVMI